MRPFVVFILAAAFTLNAEESFASFTGKVVRDKVRMRVEPTLDSPIIRELNKDDVLVVTGEKEDFYAVKPPADIKAYIYRTYVLDNIVEGNHVNVRLSPDTESPVVAQLNTGDVVIGKISDASNRWMEIAPPPGVQFYIAKEFVTKIGNPNLLENLTKREQEVKQLLDASTIMGSIEIEKPFDQIVLEDIYANLDTIINDYAEFPEQVEEAKQYQQKLKEEYLEKKISYLETRATGESTQFKEEKSAPAKKTLPPPQISEADVDPQLAPWLPVENSVFADWANENASRSQSEFYHDQREKSILLRGIVEPYNRPVRNKPGDYVLLNTVSRTPVAFLYSTKINLGNYEEQEVTLRAVERPNNNFAFPAYFVLSIE